MQQGTEQAAHEIIVSVFENAKTFPGPFMTNDDLATDVVEALGKGGFVVRRPDSEDIQAAPCPSVWHRPDEELPCQRGQHGDNQHAAIRGDGTVASWIETL